MPSTSKKQARFMAAVAHNPDFARRAGLPQSVGQDFNQADQKTGILHKTKGGKVGALKRVSEWLKDKRNAPMFGENTADYHNLLQMRGWDPELTEEEVRSLVGYGEGNLWAWKQPQIDKFNQHVRELGIAPKRELYRGLELPSHIVEGIKTGDVKHLTSDRPMSMSSDYDTAHDFAHLGAADPESDPQPVLLHIHDDQQKALPIPFSGQSELVAPSTDMFKVLGVKSPNKTGTTVVHVRRTPKDDDGFAKGGRAGTLRALSEALDNWKANKLPQRGFFSTLDELIANSPEETMPAYMWQKYLQPGQMLKRGEMQFPLKKEEIEYAKIPALGSNNPDQRLTRDQVREYARQNRPDIRTNLSKDASYDPENFAEQRGLRGSRGEDPSIIETRYDDSGLRHEPGIPGSYEESVTMSPDIGNFRSHFSPKDISWSRSTRHPVDDATLRLIEEIQSDRHSAAAERAPQEPTGQGNVGTALEEGFIQPGERMGYRTPEHERFLMGHGIDENMPQGLRGDLHNFITHRLPPDAPFKDPRDYATLEMRKQLLDAVNSGDRYLGLTRGQDQINRYEQGMDARRSTGMNEIYDKVYPSVLQKLAQKYGTDVRPLSVPIKSDTNIRPQALVDNEFENLDDLMNTVENKIIDNGDPYAEVHGEMSGVLHDLAKEYKDVFGPEKLKPINKALRNYNKGFDASGFGSDEDGAHEDHLYNLLTQVVGSMKPLEKAWNEKFSKEVIANKSFPAMDITPDTAELVRKIGVPLWSLGAGAVGLDALQQDSPPEEQTYADGGRVGTLVQALHALSFNPRATAGRLANISKKPQLDSAVENLKYAANTALANGKITPEDHGALESLFLRYGDTDTTPLDETSIDALLNLHQALYQP